MSREGFFVDRLTCDHCGQMQEMHWPQGAMPHKPLPDGWIEVRMLNIEVRTGHRKTLSLDVDADETIWMHDHAGIFIITCGEECLNYRLNTLGVFIRRAYEKVKAKEHATAETD